MPDRRDCAQWGARGPRAPAALDVLIPTAGRVAELAVTLAGLAAQDRPAFRVIVSDQSDDATTEAAPSPTSSRTPRSPRTRRPR